MKKNKKIRKNFDGASYAKFNLVRPIEVNNLDLTKKIGKSQKIKFKI